MLTDLERRRQAIAAALRAVMAEPSLPPKPAVTAFAAAATPPSRGIGARPLVTDQPARTMLTARVAMPAASAAGSELLTFREALASQIEWDEFDDVGEDSDTPVVPPLEIPGSMSRAASVALFGHA